MCDDFLVTLGTNTMTWRLALIMRSMSRPSTTLLPVPANTDTCERFVTVQDGPHQLSLVLFQRQASLPKDQPPKLLIEFLCTIGFHILLGSGAADGLSDANRCLGPLRRPGPSELSELEEDGTDVALCVARLGSRLAESDGIGSVELADGIGSVKLDCSRMPILNRSLSTPTPLIGDLLKASWAKKVLSTHDSKMPERLGLQAILRLDQFWRHFHPPASVGSSWRRQHKVKVTAAPHVTACLC